MYSATFWHSGQEIKELAKAVHDEIYSIENTLKRRGYRYAGKGHLKSLILPTSIANEQVDSFYKQMKSRTFRNILKEIVAKRNNLYQADYLKYCNETKLSEYFDFLTTIGVIHYNDNTCSYSLTSRANDFGPTLEWYVSEIFKREFSSTADWGVKIKNVKPGGDFDVLARVESTLAWIETKSTSPDNINETDIRHFLQRDQNLDPDMSIFLVDTNSDLSSLVESFIDIMSPALARDSNIKGPDYRIKIKRLPDFGGIYFTSRRIFIINSSQSIQTNLMHCLNYYFAIVAHSTYLSRSQRIDFLPRF